MARPTKPKSNGHAKPSPPEERELFPSRAPNAVNEWDKLQAEIADPVHPEKEFPHLVNGPAYKFYQSINWAQWWDEFCQCIDTSGKRKYPTVLSFARKKGKSEQKMKWIMQAIGPRPTPENNEPLPLPWLGDWEHRRTLGYWAFDDPKKIASIRQVIEERKQGLEAVKALQPFVFDDLMRWARLAQKIDEAFGGEPYLQDQAPTSAKNIARFRHYVGMHKTVMQARSKLFEQWLMANGLHPDSPNDWLAMFGMIASGAAAGAAAGATLAAGQGTPGNMAILPPGVTRFDVLLATAARRKSELFRLKPPEIKPEDLEDIPGEVKKKNQEFIDAEEPSDKNKIH